MHDGEIVAVASRSTEHAAAYFREVHSAHSPSRRRQPPRRRRRTPHPATTTPAPSRASRPKSATSAPPSKPSPTESVDTTNNSDASTAHARPDNNRLPHRSAAGPDQPVDAATTPRWNRSSRCCRRTYLTANAGRTAMSSASRSSCGSNGPTTAAAVNVPSEDSHPSNMKHSPRRTRGLGHATPRVNQNPRQSRSMSHTAKNTHRPLLRDSSIWHSWFCQEK